MGLRVGLVLPLLLWLPGAVAACATPDPNCVPGPEDAQAPPPPEDPQAPPAGASADAATPPGADPSTEAPTAPGAPTAETEPPETPDTRQTVAADGDAQRTDADAAAAHAQVEAKPQASAPQPVAEQAATLDDAGDETVETAEPLVEGLDQAAPDTLAFLEVPDLTDALDAVQALEPLGSIAVGVEAALDASDGVTVVANVYLLGVAHGQEGALDPPDAPGFDPEPTPAQAGTHTDQTGPPVPLSAEIQAASSDPVAPIPLAAIAVTGAVTGTAAASALLVAPGARTALWRAFRRLAPLLLFTRLGQDAVARHPRRAEILEFVRANPGERIEEMRHALGLPNGTMLYHLGVLARNERIRIVREGSVARLYLAGPRIQPTPYVPPIRRRLLEALRTAPGATQRHLARSLGLSERMISYHVRRLQMQGLVEVHRAGVAKILRPAPVAPVPVIATA